MKEVIFKLPDEVLTLIIHKVANTPQEASLLEKWIYDGEERKTGKWIKGGYCCGETEWICPKCNASEWRTNRVPFCPWCGNPMEVNE